MEESSTQQKEQKPLLIQSLQDQINTNPSGEQLQLILDLLQKKSLYAAYRDSDYLHLYNKFYRPIGKIFRFTNISPKNSMNEQFNAYGLVLEGYSYEKKFQCVQKASVHAHKIQPINTNNKNVFKKQDQEIFEKKINNALWIQQHPAMLLFKCNKLPLQEQQRQQLITLLNNHADKTQDFNETCPVQDIVDPELNPNYAYKNYKLKNKENNQLIKSRSNSSNSYNCEELKDLELEEKDYKSLRSQYQWIPTIFKVDNIANKAQIIGEIHNLPRQDNEELYSLLEQIFILQYPMLKKVNCLKETTEFQVVFKAQKYLIKPNQQYEGKWHLEGKTENIKATSVYYIDIDQGFQKDELNFKTLGDDEDDYRGQVDVDIQSECCLVFENNIPHKFNALTNKTDKTLQRLFINFFIISPEYPISLTESDIKQIFQTISIKLNQNTTSIVMGFLGLQQQNLEAAKQKRLEMRQNSHKEINGWGYIHYGNCGGLKFVDTFSTDKYYRHQMTEFQTNLESQ